ncbi:3-hydroxyadipyl-CoA dehydrogenase [Phycisphaerae bacterium RAS1]|nr:3-hydroxyadipyl-CoA dehydrogenase [Phycisphaerae bacterium RAS1]
MPTVGIIGAGTMGGGIAQVAATAGWNVLLTDVDAAAVQRKLADIRRQLDKLVEKGRMSAEQRSAAAPRLKPAASSDLRAAELIIEAIVENLQAKIIALGPLAAANPAAIFATNTSSLSVTQLARGVAAALSESAARLPRSAIAGRFVGMHFFNPVPLMPLVEVIAGDDSDPAAVQRVFEIATSWGKTAVRAKDTPGFIVNRVARGYYLESLRMLGEGIAGVDEIDQVMRTLGGFRMGPFELMDMIGIDVNYTVSCSVWEQLAHPARLTPHHLQRDLFEHGHFGRKSKRGFYSYASEPPLPAVIVDRRSFSVSGRLYEAVRRFCDGATRTPASATEQYIFSRVLATIINEASLLLDDGAADAASIDTAMKLATNYPAGPLEWADRIGRHTVASLLRQLNEAAADARFRPADSLQ